MPELMFIWTGWAFGGNDYELGVGSCLRQRTGAGWGRRCEVLCEAGRWLAGHRVDNGNISLLGSNIMLKVNGSWRMKGRNDSRSPRPGTRSSFKDAVAR